jgi:hypothetical protein
VGSVSRETTEENESMRCPDCKYDQRYRYGTRCGQCGYQFVFRKNVDQITDSALRQMIQRLSDNGQYAFTATQLALTLCRHWRRTAWYLIFCGLSALLIAAWVLTTNGLGFIGALLFVVALPLVIYMGRRPATVLPFHKACALIDRYHQAHPIAGLADGKAFARQDAPLDSQDLYYAPERILVVERDELVDLLVRNRFHLTAKTAVISRSGYPAHLLAACREFLRRHPQTPVQLLHDASSLGFGLAAQLAADPHWPLAPHPLVDLGIAKEALDKNARLPWLPALPNKPGVLSADHSRMLRAGGRIPVDYLGPKPLLSLLSAAVIGGALLLVARDALGSLEMGVEVDYG